MPHTPSLASRYPSPALLCALLVIVLALFWPGRGGAFLLDDKPTIIDNPAVHITKLDAESLGDAAYSFAAGEGSRALPMLTFGLDYWRAGADPAAFRTTNIIIHALTALALAGFFRLLLAMAGWRSKQAAYAAPALALAWAIHPLQVSSVLYIVQRMQTMCSLFLVLALWAYLLMRQAQIKGERSRQFGILTGFFWVLALASKEDSILLPAYTLALELTILRFSAAQPQLTNGLRRGYLFATMLGTAIFLFLAVPHYWSWQAYPYRDFSSLERLLTQCRVLAMYLGQILMPLPDSLHFYYDDITPSHSLLQPPETLLTLLLLGALLALAWRLRKTRPLFALGVFLFFAGHFITSNVVGLELAFEHRNHFPLIGAVLAVGDMLTMSFQRLEIKPRTAMIAVTIIFSALASATTLRVQAWGTPLGFAEYSTRLAPNSERAWINLCRTNFELSNGITTTSYFDKAVQACKRGGEIPYGASALASSLLLKTKIGSATQADWNLLLARLETVPMTPENQGIAWYMARNASRDERLDSRNISSIIDIISRRAGFRPDEYAGFGYFMLKKDPQSPEAQRYFSLAIKSSPPNSELVRELIEDLRTHGHLGLANQLEIRASMRH